MFRYFTTEMLVLFLRMAGTDFMIEEDYTGVSLPRAA